ncbi:MAG: tetratricopeptide repeat protein [Acidobacteriota bacterium]|nr:tetratricopeptide repeat protein [Acidobacteriota bacterium]
MRRPIVPSLLILLSLAGCSQYQPIDAAAYIRGEYVKRVGPDLARRIEVPFALDEKVQAAFDKVRPAPSEHDKVKQVLDFVFQRMDLQYELTPTRNAVAVFETRKGNCLSFVNLFVGLARQRGLNPFYVEVTDYQTWNHREGMVVSQGHIVGGVYLDGELKTYDFLPYHPKAYRKFKPIDDLTAVAHYYNNLGAEALMRGDAAAARPLLEIATGVAPRFEKALNNMGIAVARAGQLDRAVEIYQRGLGITPDDPILLTNLARAYQELGRREEADRTLQRVEELNISNPYFFVYQGEAALNRGDEAKALDYLTRALRLDSEAPEVHLGFVKVFLARGEMERARHHLERALKLDPTNRQAREYARMLRP